MAMKKLTILAALVFVVAFGFAGMVRADGVADDCKEGNLAFDVDTVAVTSDGNNITVVVVLCQNADDRTKYRLHLDYQDLNVILSDGNQSCVTTSDDTMMLRGNRETGPGDIVNPSDSNTITYTVSYAELGLVGGDPILVWVDTQYKGIKDRAPDTNSGDGCSKPQILDEVIQHTLSSS